MNKRMFKGFIFLFCVILIGGCTDNDNSKLVDRQYLQSNDYAEFESSFKQELLHNENNNKSFSEYLEQLTNCQQVQELKLPFTIDTDFLIQLQENVPETCVVGSSQKPSYSLILIANSTYKDIDIYWILLDRPSVYRNQGLFAATFKNDSLLNYNTAGSLEKDLSKKVTTQVRVREAQDNLEVISKTTRKIIYPFEQKNTLEDVLIINSHGEIHVKK